MPAITSQNVVQAIVKLVAAQGLPAVMGNLIMGQLVNRDYEPIMAQAGDTINIPIPPTMKSNNLAEGGSVQTQNPSLGNAQVVLNMHSESSFTIPDVVSVVTQAANGNFDLLGKYMHPAMIALAEDIETNLLALVTNLTANTAVGTANTTITETAIDLAEKALFDAKVPVAERKCLVLSSQSYSDARQIERFSEDRMKAGEGNVISDGVIGRIKNFDVFRSQFVSKVGNQTNNVAFARDAFALAMRRLPQPIPGTGAIAEYGELGNFGMRIVMSYAPGTLAQQFTVDCLYGVAVLRNIYGVGVLS